MPVKRLTAIMILTCLLVLALGTASTAAASFDLLLKGHWAYAELAILADGGLLEGYRSAAELAEVYPLTRYEVALLIGDLVVATNRSASLGGLSADTLMWKMLENRDRNGDGAVRLSSETVAQTRTASEAAYKALTRLAEEFADELNTLGITDSEMEKGLFYLSAGSRSVDPGGLKNAEILAQLGATRLWSPLPATFQWKNGFSLSNGLIVDTAALSFASFAALSKTVHSQESLASTSVGLAELPPADALAPAEDIYSPIEVSALVEKLEKEQGDPMLIASEPLELATPAEAEEASLKLVANMTDNRPSRPAGLLTSYFLNRAGD